MKYLYRVVRLLTCTSVLCQSNGPSATDVTRNELVEVLNSTCSTPTACDEKQDTQFSGNCECGPSCVHRATCCVDSPHRLTPPPKVTATCRPILGSENVGFFMVDKCQQQSDESKSIFADLCEEEWSGQRDVMRLVPVTSLFSHVAYKNYFCFRCHELGDDYVFWDLKVEFYGGTDEEEACGDIHLEYDDFFRSWSAPVGRGCRIIPVNVRVESPAFTEHLLKACLPNLISNCSEYWQDESVRTKCDSYQHRITIETDSNFLEYRNPHCALCNYENLDYVTCDSVGVKYGGDRVEMPFLSTLLIDIKSC